MATPPLATEDVVAQYNRRNVFSNKIVKTASGDIPIQIPRDRNAEFEPLLIQKHKRRLEGIDDAVLALYARGMSMRDIRYHRRIISSGFI